jgi:HD domain
VTATVGTLEWAERTGGRLRHRDRARLLGQFALLFPSLPREVLSRLGLDPRRQHLESPRPHPETAIADDAAAVCQAASAECRWLYPHSVRTFLFAQLFAQVEGIEFDPEVLWVAAMLHDVGFTDSAAAPVRRHTPCFAVRGAHEIQALAERHRWSVDQTRGAMAAITLHVNVRVPQEASAEGHLLNLGSGFDVAGLRYAKIYSAAMLDALADHPHGDFPTVIGCAWQKESSLAAGCRVAFLQHWGFRRLIRSSPLRRVGRSGPDRPS